MKKIKLFARSIFVCLLLSITAMASASESIPRSYPEGSPVALNGQLKVENGRMVNECGYPVQLRGMSTHGLAWNTNTYNASSMKALVEDWNISLFRIAVYTHEWGGYCMTKEQYPSKFWKSRDDYHVLIDKLVDLCAQYGIYCLIDWHVLNEGSGNPMSTYDDAEYFFNYMSKTHANDKHVIYEICNEPNGVSWASVYRYANKIIPVIRANDPDKIIVCGTPTWSQDVDAAADAPLKYDNLMYTLHFYAGSHMDDLRAKANKALQKGLALFVTEFGTSRANGSGGVFTEECDKWFEWMNKKGISWANWSFSDKSETSAALKSGSANSQNWNNTSTSGTYIKGKLLENYKDNFVACTDTTPYYVAPEVPEEEEKGDLVEDVNNKVNVTLYPNPSKDGSFSIDAPFEIERVVVCDLLGNEIEVFEIPNTIYITHNLNEGIYLVKVYGSKFITVKQFIVK